MPLPANELSRAPDLVFGGHALRSGRLVEEVRVGRQSLSGALDVRVVYVRLSR